jgi:hypothetical protein
LVGHRDGLRDVGHRVGYRVGGAVGVVVNGASGRSADGCTDGAAVGCHVGYSEGDHGDHVGGRVGSVVGASVGLVGVVVYTEGAQDGGHVGPGGVTGAGRGASVTCPPARWTRAANAQLKVRITVIDMTTNRSCVNSARHTLTPSLSWGLWRVLLSPGRVHGGLWRTAVR